MALDKTEQRILVRAAELISNEKAWMKGDLFGVRWDPVKGHTVHDYDRYCALGAVSRAAREEYTRSGTSADERYAHTSRVRNALTSQLSRDYYTIPDFNDNPSTTHADVKKLFCDTVKAEVTDDTGE